MQKPVFKFKDDKLTPEQLFELSEYKDFRTVKIGMSKVLRCRPIFQEWSTEIEMIYDEERIDESEVIKIVTYAGRYIGVCDYRPKFGRFDVKVIK